MNSGCFCAYVLHLGTVRKGMLSQCTVIVFCDFQVVRDFESTASSSLGFGRELVSFLSPQIQVGIS